MEWLDSAELLKLWEEQKWDELMIKLYPLIRAICYKKKFPCLDYQDALQDVAIKVYSRLSETFDPQRGNIVAFSITVASQAMWEHLRDQTKQTEMFQTGQMEDWFDAPVGPEQDESEPLDDFIRCIRQVREKVNRNRKKVLDQIIYALEQNGPLNQIEITNRVDMNKANVNKLLLLVKNHYKKSRKLK
jgi:RNA polymerase sigma factor (sigma-70 family)